MAKKVTTRKPTAKKNQASSEATAESRVIIPISDDIPIGDEKRPLSWYRERLNSVQALCWDKAIDGLNSTKAQGKWVDFMSVIERLAKEVEMCSEDLVVDLCLDPVTTAEIGASRESCAG